MSADMSRDVSRDRPRDMSRDRPRDLSWRDMFKIRKGIHPGPRHLDGIYM